MNTDLAGAQHSGPPATPATHRSGSAAELVSTSRKALSQRQGREPLPQTRSDSLAPSTCCTDSVPDSAGKPAQSTRHNSTSSPYLQSLGVCRSDNRKFPSWGLSIWDQWLPPTSAHISLSEPLLQSAWDATS